MSKMRVWHMPQVGSCDATLYIPVENEREAKKVMDLLACYDLFQLENNIKPDFSNCSGLQIFNEIENEWGDWFKDDDEGFFEDIDEYFENDEKVNDYSKELFGQLKGI